MKARTYKGEMDEGGPGNDFERQDYLLVFDKDGQMLCSIDICEESGSIFTSQDKFIYIEPYTGVVYQLCPDETTPSLIGSS